jgi:hypothetical protein
MCQASGVVRGWAVTLVVVLFVLLGALLGVAGLRLAQMRAVPLAAPRALPACGAGSTTLEVSDDAWAYAGAPAVEDVLTRYFNAINSKNYAAWVATVTPAKSAQQTEAAWRQGYVSTVDGTIRLSRIDEVGPGRLVAMVSYLSTQRPEDGPPGVQAARICWRESIPLIGDPPRIDVGKSGSILRGAC